MRQNRRQEYPERSLRVTRPLRGVSVGEVPTRSDGDLQTGRGGVVGQRQFHVPAGADTLRQAALGADATEAILREAKTLPF